MSVIINMLGDDYAIQFVKASYWTTNNLAIRVLCEDEEYGGWTDFACLTVNIPDIKIYGNYAFIDTNNCTKEIIDWLLKQKYMEIIGETKSGFCTYPLVRFSDDFIDYIAITEDDLNDEDE